MLVFSSEGNEFSVQYTVKEGRYLLHLTPCSLNTIAIERAILNSQPQYVNIAYKQSSLSEQDIITQHDEADEYKTSRFLVVDEDKVIGLVDYGFSSPRQQLPWINLLCIDAKFNYLGYGKKVFQLIEQNMYTEGARELLIAVHKQNERARAFWTSLGFQAFEERDVQGDMLISLQKTLKNQS